MSVGTERIRSILREELTGCFTHPGECRPIFLTEAECEEVLAALSITPVALAMYRDDDGDWPQVLMSDGRILQFDGAEWKTTAPPIPEEAVR